MPKNLTEARKVIEKSMLKQADDLEAMGLSEQAKNLRIRAKNLGKSDRESLFERRAS